MKSNQLSKQQLMTVITEDGKGFETLSVLSKPKPWGVKSAKNAYAKLGADGDAQLLDIRAPSEFRQVGTLDVLHSNSLKDAVQKFFQPEILDGNKYKCDKNWWRLRNRCLYLKPLMFSCAIEFGFRDLRAYWVGRSIRLLHLKIFWCFLASCAKQARIQCQNTGSLGRWYRHDDSSVSLSTLKEVVRKGLRTFFSRTNQRSVPIRNGFASNGSRSHDSHNINGSQASECPKSDAPAKVVHAKLSSQQSSWKDVSAMSKTDKELSSPRIKFNFNGNSTSKRGHESLNGKVDVLLPVLTNGHVKDSVALENAKKDSSSIRNGFDKNKVDAFENLKRNDPLLTNKNNGIHSVEKYPRKSDVMDDTRISRAISVRSKSSGTERHA
ncbi:hypothetical protein K1719_042113 [Acacia pycnantha]|nr:hypothetical protein K1719_042113 [Acacia pycnantha]